jgi:WhiB family redox-sensing transcriptional regulator
VTTRTLGEADVSWMGAAACANKGPDSWFSEVHPVEALRVCSECPVRDACLDYALSTNQEHGIWGGLTQEERKNVRRSRRRSA